MTLYRGGEYTDPFAHTQLQNDVCKSNNNTHRVEITNFFNIHQMLQHSLVSDTHQKSRTGRSWCIQNCYYARTIMECNFLQKENEWFQLVFHLVKVSLNWIEREWKRKQLMSAKFALLPSLHLLSGIRNRLPFPCRYSMSTRTSKRRCISIETSTFFYRLQRPFSSGRRLPLKLHTNDIPVFFPPADPLHLFEI